MTEVDLRVPDAPGWVKPLMPMELAHSGKACWMGEPPVKAEVMARSHASPRRGVQEPLSAGAERFEGRERERAAMLRERFWEKR
jgi:hypothetical protein